MQISRILDILGELPYFTKQNLALALGKDGEDLNYWMKKLSKEKLILPLKKGFYISAPYKNKISAIPSEYETYWAYLANMLRSPSYVSLEYVLSKYSLIPESVFAITSVTLKSPRKYISTAGTFIYRSIREKLYTGYQQKAFGNSGITVKIAYPYKALFDFLYLKSFASNEELKNYLFSEGRFNWTVLTDEDKIKFMEISQKSGSVKMNTIAKILEKGGIL